MFAIKDTSHFNLENFPYDYPNVVCENQSGDLESFGVAYDMWLGINTQSEINKYMNVYSRRNWIGNYDWHMIKLNSNNVPEKYIITYD